MSNSYIKYMANRVISIDRVESSPTEPVTLAQVRAHLIITFTDDDTQLTTLITQCRQAVENYCHISIVRQIITAVLCYDCPQDLPYPPVTNLYSVQSSVPSPGSGPISYETATSGWQQDGNEFSGGGVRNRLVYGAGYATVPEQLKLAILNEIAFRYENRGNNPLTDGLCEAARILAVPFKVMLWI